MSYIKRLAVILAAGLLPIACTTTNPETVAGARPEIIFDGIGGIWQPAMDIPRNDRPLIPDGQRYLAAGPFEINIPDVATVEPGTPNLKGLEMRRGGGRIESPLSDEQMEKLRNDARFLRASPFVQDISEGAPVSPSLAPATAGVGFPTIDYTQCCGGGGNVPPDPELAAGPNHVIAVVNVAFQIFDTNGVSQGSVRTFASFFNGVPGCTGVFDPNANYDEAADRFILGIDGDGGSYCVAVSKTADPTGEWYRYSFQTASGRDFFDYPHAGVGEDAIYLGANIFGARRFKEGRVWAIDKFDMYAGTAPTIVSFGTGSDGTPQPMNLHGFNQGTWPSGGPHYILTDGASFNGASYGVWSWSNPFSGGVPVKKPTEVNLNTATGVPAGMPVDAPQAGGGNLQANDFRGQDAEFRNGHIWMSHAMACNPGGGTVNCLRWAEIDPTGPSVVNAGVYGSPGQYRSFPDLAVDSCGNMMMGYSKTSASTNPGVFAVGRDSSGAVQTEISVKNAEGVYVAFDGAPYRWGDYTEMTIAPDGSTFWYLGEYSKNTGNNNGKWGTWISSFTFGCSGGGNAPPVAVIATPPNCTLLSCNFVGSNSTDDNGIKTFAWTFGDGNSSALADPQHSYAVKGTYDVSLTVTDFDGASDTANDSLTVDDGVNISPNAVITLIDCNNSTRNCSFNGSGSSDSDGTIKSYNWLFGDDNTGSGVSTSHTYAAYGEYTARLTVTDNEDATDFAEAPVSLTDPGSPITMSVTSILVDTLNLSGGYKSPRATATVQDNQGNFVGSVQVSGVFTGDAPGSDSQPTDSSGSAVLVSGDSKKGKVIFEFCITTVSGGSLAWDGVKPCASN